MSYKLLTNLLFEPRGKHNPSLTYNIKDTVVSEDGSKVYFALDNVPAGIPLTDTNYWMLQIDLSASKNAMDVAAANARTQTDATIASANTRVEDMMGKAADAVTSVADYAAKVGMRVKGETKITKGNPMTIYPDGGSLLKVQTDIPIKQLGSGEPYPVGSGKNKLVPPNKNEAASNVRADYSFNNDTGTYRLTKVVEPTLWSQFIQTFDATVLSGKNVVLSYKDYTITSAGHHPRIYILDIDGTTTYASMFFEENNKKETTFAIPAGVTSLILLIRIDQEKTAPIGTVLAINGLQLEIGTVATEFTPPSNIRSFIGYDKLELTAHGMNMYNKVYESGRWDVSGNYAKLPIPCKPGVAYSWSLKDNAFAGSGSYALFTDQLNFNGGNYDGGLRQWVGLGGVDAANTEFGTFTGPVSGVVYLGILAAQGDKALELLQNLMLVEGAYTAATMPVYKPYDGKRHIVQIGQTVYGGKFEWLTGKLVVEWAMKTLNGTEVFEHFSVAEGELFRTTLSGAYGETDVVSDTYVTVAKTQRRNFSMYANPAIGGLDIIDSRFTSADSFKSNLTQNPVRIIYKLKTPIEIQLAPNVITAVEDGGVNHIYGDADLTVEWVKPLSESIKERTDVLLDAFSESFETSGSIIQCEPIGNWPFDSVVTEFSPKQEGSGDPYPAGGGKNLLVDVTVFDTVWLKGVISLTAGITYTLSVQETADALYFSNEGGTVDYATAYNAKHLTYTPETSGIHVLFARYANGADLAYNMMLEKGSAAIEYTPYSNIRPITGYDVMKLNHAGKNLMPVLSGSDTNRDGIEWKNNRDGSWTANGTATAAAYIAGGGMAFYLGVLPAGEYKLNVVASSRETGKLYLRIGSGAVSTYLTSNDAQSKDKECTFVADGVTDYYAAIAIKSGETVKDYRIFPVLADSSHSVWSINFGQTVYGGKFDWLTGKLVAEWTMKTFDGGEVVSTDSEGSGIFTTNAFATAFEVYCDNCCSHYASTRDYDTFMTKDMSIAIWGSGQIRIHDSRFKSTAEINSYYESEKSAGTPVQVAYKLATPIEIQLTPTEIIALPGVNTLYGDGDTITAKFRQSKDVDILKRLSALETLMTNQTKGE